MDKKKINVHLWVPNLFEYKGGIQVYLQDFLETLIQSFPDYSVVVFNKLDKNQPADKLELKNTSFIFSGNIPIFLRSFHFAFQLILGSLKERPQLIICGHLNFAPIAYLIHRLTGIPYWICVYGADAWNINNYWKKQALHNADKIISISNYTSDRLIHEQKLNPEKIALLPVTFDASRWSIAPKPQYLLDRYQFSSDQPLILTVGRMSKDAQHKGYDRLIHTLPTIIQAIPNIHYLIVGKGDDRPCIEQLIKSLNLEKYVTLTGFIPDQELVDYYNLCDIFAMPSKAEGFGIVYLEALACGKPTLGGNQDGAIDALCHGEIGVLVDPNNLEEIAQAIIKVLQGTCPNPIIYQPETLRQKVIETYGSARFKTILTNLVKNQI
ncbi:MAG: glycosyltransferase family 4 protein [Coleofasciculaceae cyanobacterium]